MENEDIQVAFHQAVESEEILQLVSFMVGEEEFAMDILPVQEINRVVDITRVPNAPEYVIGVINLRGKVIPIIDLRMRLGLESVERDSNTRIIVFELSGKVLGFIVDSVNEVITIEKSLTEPPPPMVSGIDSKFIISIAKLKERLLILLDLEAIVINNSNQIATDEIL